MNKSNPKHVSDFLEAQFQELAEGTAAPSELQDEVFNTLDTLGLLGDIAELFTLNFTKSEAIVIDAAFDSLNEDLEKE